MKRAEGAEDGAALLAELLSDPGQLEARLDDPRFHSADLAAVLLGESEAEVFPPSRFFLAALALEIAERLDPRRFSGVPAVELKVRAGCELARAKRQMLDPEGARHALRQVARDLSATPLDALERAFYGRELALHRKAEGGTDEALALLQRSARLCEDLESRLESGRALLEEGWLRLENGEAGTGEAVLLEAIRRIEPAADPRSALRARYGLGLCRADLGRRSEALQEVREARKLHPLLPRRVSVLQAFVWEAEVAKRCGRHRRAMKTLQSAIEGLIAEGALGEAAILALNLLDLYGKQGAMKEMEGFRRSGSLAFLSSQLSERIALLLSLAIDFSVSRREAAPALLPRIAELLRIAFYSPDRPYPRGEAVTALDWDGIDAETRRFICKTAGMDEEIAGLAACEIGENRAELLSWVFEELTGARVLFGGCE